MAEDTHKGRKCPPSPRRGQLHEETPLSGKEEEEVGEAGKLTSNPGGPGQAGKQKEARGPRRAPSGDSERQQADTNSRSRLRALLRLDVFQVGMGLARFLPATFLRVQTLRTDLLVPMGQATSMRNERARCRLPRGAHVHKTQHNERTGMLVCSKEIHWKAKPQGLSRTPECPGLTPEGLREGAHGGGSHVLCPGYGGGLTVNFV